MLQQGLSLLWSGCGALVTRGRCYASFGDSEYWRDFYAKRREEDSAAALGDRRKGFEWFCDGAAILDYVDRDIDSSTKILHVGAGTSDLGNMLLSETSLKAEHLTEIDYVDTGRASVLRYDLRRLPRTWTNRYHSVYDKGCLDALAFAGSSDFRRAVENCLRVVRFDDACASRNVLVSISNDPPEMRCDMLTACDSRLRVTFVDLSTDNEDDTERAVSPPECYLYLCRVVA